MLFQKYGSYNGKYKAKFPDSGINHVVEFIRETMLIRHKSQPHNVKSSTRKIYYLNAVCVKNTQSLTICVNRGAGLKSKFVGSHNENNGKCLSAVRTCYILYFA